MTELHELSAVQLASALQAGETDPVAVAKHFLARIEVDNSTFGAFITVDAPRALARAATVRDEVSKSAPLWGMPTGAKDLWQTKGLRTTFGSRLFAEHIPETNDDIIDALDAAGTVCLGKTNTPEFGVPPYTEPAAGPIARSPLDPARTAGGSSGGAAAAVASRMLPLAPGSDGGGSIRIPSACCGLVGIKPSRGMVPTGSGIDTLGGLAVAGPIARSVEDAAFLLEALIAPRGRAEHLYALRAPELTESAHASALHPGGTFKIAVVTNSPWEDQHEITIDDEPRNGLDAAIKALTGLGHEVEELTLIASPGYSNAFQTVWHGGSATIPVPDEHLDALEPLTAWSIRNGRQLSAAQIVAALGLLTAFERNLIAQIGPYDAVIAPALAKLPPVVGSFDPVDPQRDFVQQVQFTPFTSMANVAGLPSISLPVANSTEGFPISVLLTGNPGGENTLIKIAAQLESSTGVGPMLWRP